MSAKAEVSMVGQVMVISEADFEPQVLQAAESVVLVYFWASWCGPCRLVVPSVEWAAKHYADRLKVLKIEVDPNPKAVARCQVKGVPALRIFKQGELVESLEGAITKQKLVEILETHLTQA